VQKGGEEPSAAENNRGRRETRRMGGEACRYPRQEADGRTQAARGKEFNAEKAKNTRKSRTHDDAVNKKRRSGEREEASFAHEGKPLPKTSDWVVFPDKPLEGGGTSKSNVVVLPY